MTGLRWIAVAVPLLAAAPGAWADGTTTLPGLLDSAQVVRDEHDIPHIFANNEHDLFFLQGWITAEDRLFQMDVSRHQASGRLAELLGPDSLADDVQLRQVGLRRAAEVTLPILSQPVKDALQAYADGVNAWISTHPLPPDYAAVELTHVEPWTALDCVTIAKLLAFGLSFDLTDMDLTIAYIQYQLAAQKNGVDANALFFDDMFRIAPFDPAATVPDASQAVPALARSATRTAGAPLSANLLKALQGYADRIRNTPLLGEALTHRRGNGSNEWVVAGSHTVNGLPLLASDPHQPLTAPSLFHQVHLSAPGFDVVGNSLEGAPLVVLGHNENIAWGATVNPMDAVDLFLEKIVRDKSSPSGLSIVHEGHNEPIISLPQQFFVNQPHDNLPDDLVPAPSSQVPANVLIVPRRNNGPLVVSVPLLGFGVSIQYTGFGPTRETETFYIWNHAHNLADFTEGLHHFDFGSQNFTFADVAGNIAYFTSGALPLREDLEAGHVNGLPPYFIRNGQTGNEWIPEPNPPPGQILPYKLLPFDEMPHIVNPPAGFIVSANSDPNGNTLDNDPLNVLRPTGGILYLNPAYVSIRAGRITEMLRQRIVDQHQKIDITDMQAMQADVTLHDAEVFVPYILRASDNAKRPGAPLKLKLVALDARVAEAIGRFRNWDFTTPTGVVEGYDAADIAGQPPSPPSNDEIAKSVAATIYAVWRSEALTNIIDAPVKKLGLTGPHIHEIGVADLRHLLDTFDDEHGVGASGIDFFAVSGLASAPDRRDYQLLKSLRDALNLLKSSTFAAAFHNSTNQNDYRWGRLHRIVFEHPLGGQFNFPPAGGAFPSPFPDLAGIPTDGGFETVDVAAHGDPHASTPDDFMFDSGSANRFTSKVVDGKMTAATALPGGESGDITSSHYVDLLPIWLVDDTYPLRTDPDDIDAHASSTDNFLPAVQAGPP
jgi:penicillin G amidase